MVRSVDVHHAASHVPLSWSPTNFSRAGNQLARVVNMLYLDHPDDFGLLCKQSTSPRYISSTAGDTMVILLSASLTFAFRFLPLAMRISSSFAAADQLDDQFAIISKDLHLTSVDQAVFRTWSKQFATSWERPLVKPTPTRDARRDIVVKFTTNKEKAHNQPTPSANVAPAAIPVAVVARPSASVGKKQPIAISASALPSPAKPSPKPPLQAAATTMTKPASPATPATSTTNSTLNGFANVC